MNPTVHSLVLSAVDWDEVCPWLLFRKCLRLAFSFRLLLLTTLHLILVSLWLAAAFGWFTSSRTVEDLLKDYSCITAYVPHTQSAFPSGTHEIRQGTQGAISTQLSAGEIPAGNVLSEEKTGDDLRLEMLTVLEMDAPAERTQSETVLESPHPSENKTASVPSTNIVQPQEDPDASIQGSQTPALSVSAPNASAAKPYSMGQIVNQICASVYAGISTLLLWVVSARLTALQLTREFRSSFRHELKFAMAQLGSSLTAFFWIALGTFLLALPLLVCRLFPANVMVWLMPAALIYAVFYFFFLLGTGLGSFFIPSVLATENSDAFDALSRSCAYALQKPLKLVLYLLAAILFGGLGLCAIVFLVVLIEHLCLTLTGTLPLGGSSLALYAFSWSVSAWLLLYGFSALQGIYLLLRRDVDAVELENVWLSEPQGVPAPQLPKLEEAAKETA